MSLQDEMKNIEKEIENGLKTLENNEPINKLDAKITATFALVALQILKANSQITSLKVDDIEKLHPRYKAILGDLYDEELYNEILKNTFLLADGKDINQDNG